MKKYLFLSFITLFGNNLNLSAQTDERKFYTIPCVMPDGSTQLLWVKATKADANELIAIAGRNSGNTSPVTLSQKKYDGTKKFLSESVLYRFLANQLCNNCNTKKILTKEEGGYFFLKNNSGTYFIDVFYVPEDSKWFLNIANLEKFKITPEEPRPVFY